jgi:hypothetical protein
MGETHGVWRQKCGFAREVQTSKPPSTNGNAKDIEDAVNRPEVLNQSNRQLKQDFDKTTPGYATEAVPGFNQMDVVPTGKGANNIPNQ